MKKLLTFVFVIGCSGAGVPEQISTPGLTGDIKKIHLNFNPEEGSGDAIDFHSFVVVENFDAANEVLSVSVWRKYPENMTRTEVSFYHLYKDVPAVHLLSDGKSCLQMVWREEQGRITLYSSSGSKENCYFKGE